jgi:arsenite methyltransferase
LKGTPPNGQSVQEGELESLDGRATFPIANGIPRFVDSNDAGQLQTQSTFAFKWAQRGTYETDAMRTLARNFLVDRYGFATTDEMDAYFAGRTRVLDAGCGSGFSAALWLGDRWRRGHAEWVGADISQAVDLAQERIGGFPRMHFVQADVASLPFADATFDTIFSEGVLHHTPSTERSLKALARVLAPGGELLFYVYRRKAPLREFADDHIRAALSTRSPEDAWSALRPLTALARALADLNVAVDLDEDIPYLGIRKGRHDVQRLIYWHFLKLFWNPALDFEANNHVNYDWYAPAYAHRHTEDELRRWCAEAGLTIARFDDRHESGFTVRAVRALIPDP